MQKVFAILSGAFLVFVTGSGCHPPMRYDPSQFDPQCSVWQEQWYSNNKSAQFVAESKGMEAYYEYYMCMEMRSTGLPDTERMQYFFENINNFIKIVPSKLQSKRNWKELYALSSILWMAHVNKYYNVGADTNLMKTWHDAIYSKSKNGGFNDSLYFGVIRSKY